MARSGKFVVNSYPKPAQKPQQPPKVSLPRTCVTTQINWILRLEFVLSMLNRLLIGFITIYVCWLCLRQHADEIPWHACLCTLGFACLMAEGLMAHYRGNPGTHSCQRTDRTRTHWILQLVGSCLGIAGVVVKLLLEEVHFPTLHGQLGLAAFVVCLLSLCSGLSSLYANELKHWLQPLLNKTAHTMLGLITFTLAMLSMWTAFETELFVEYSLDAAHYLDFRLLLQLTTLLIWVLSSYGPFWCLIYSKLWKCC